MPTTASSTIAVDAPASSQGGYARFLPTAVKAALWLLLPLSMIALGLHYLLSGMQVEQFSTSQEPVEIVVANTMLSVPANMIRQGNQRNSHTTARLELFASWPDMNGYREQTKPVFENPADVSQLIFVTIEPRSMMYDMSGRLGPIYARFFDGVGILAASGLVQQPLASSAGFVNEDLLFDPSSPYPFVARCTREGRNVIRATCMRDIHLAKDLMLTYRFDKKLLPQWADLDDRVRALGNRLK